MYVTIVAIGFDVGRFPGRSKVIERNYGDTLDCGDFPGSGGFPILAAGLAETGHLADSRRRALQVVRANFLSAVRVDCLNIGIGLCRGKTIAIAI